MKLNYWINNLYYVEELFKEKSNLNNMLNKTIFQKCSEKNIDLPCFCYHENLSIAGNCRMCLVEINTSLKLVVSCAMPMQNNLKIFTDNNRVKKARESVLEFLLVNHPLDCPICDQGGERDLQDITLIFGSDKSRFYEYFKRGVFDKECGPFIKMIMTRCIHCTRCVRFLSEVSFTYEFGMVNRGNHSEITSFIEKSVINELSGNIIDLCPVGALTSKPFAFSARAWELNSLESIDILDSMASSIRIDYLNNQIYRILPVYDRYLNEDWISNKIRFLYDCQKIQRLCFPIVRKRLMDIYYNLNWIDSFYMFFFKLKVYFKSQFEFRSIYFLFGDFNDLYTILNIKQFLDILGLDIYFLEQFIFNYDFRSNYLINDLNKIDNLIIIGTNLRIELPILNSKLRKRYLNNFINIYNFITSSNDLGIFINNDVLNIIKIIYFKNKVNLFLFYKNFNYSIYNFKKKIKSLNFFLGIRFLFQNKFSLNNYFFFNLNKFFINLYINTIVYNISYLNFFELGLKNKFYRCFFSIGYSFIFLNNLNNTINLRLLYKRGSNFVIYNGSYFDNGAKYADISFPVNMFFEYDGLFLNIEGKFRKLNKVVNFLKIIYTPCNLFKFIILSFLKNLKVNLIAFFYINLINLYKYFFFIKLNWELNYNILPFNKLKININFITFKEFKNNIILSYIYNYYKSDILSKYSKNLHLAALEYSKQLLILK